MHDVEVLESCGQCVEYDRAVLEAVVCRCSVCLFLLLAPPASPFWSPTAFPPVESDFRSRLGAGRDIAHGLGES